MSAADASESPSPSRMPKGCLKLRMNGNATRTETKAALSNAPGSGNGSGRGKEDCQRRAGETEMSEWQPIETAPKDGRILGYSAKDGQHIWWWVRQIVPGGLDRGCWENVSYEWYELDQPTHWHPLPGPPAT